MIPSDWNIQSYLHIWKAIRFFSKQVSQSNSTLHKIKSDIGIKKNENFIK